MHWLQCSISQHNSVICMRQVCKYTPACWEDLVQFTHCRLLLLQLLLESRHILCGSQIGGDVLSISSPVTVITFDEEAVDMVLADMTKITTQFSLLR